MRVSIVREKQKSGIADFFVSGKVEEEDENKEEDKEE